MSKAELDNLRELLMKLKNAVHAKNPSIYHNIKTNISGCYDIADWLEKEMNRSSKGNIDTITT
jgi:hypothetical protein